MFLEFCVIQIYLTLDASFLCFFSEAHANWLHLITSSTTFFPLIVRKRSVFSISSSRGLRVFLLPISYSENLNSSLTIPQQNFCCSCSFILSSKQGTCTVYSFCFWWFWNYQLIMLVLFSLNPHLLLAKTLTSEFHTKCLVISFDIVYLVNSILCLVTLEYPELFENYK